MTSKKIAALTLGAALTGLALSAPVEAGRIDSRQARQRARIASGVCSGSLTRGEAAALRARQRSLALEERILRRGGLTLAERRALERRQDRLSQAISRQKHDGQNR